MDSRYLKLNLTQYYRYIEIMYLTTQASDDLSVCLSVCLSLSLSHTFDFMQLYM